VPGLERQTDFWHYGAFLTADYRDDWRDPTRGGLYSAEWTRYLDQKIGRYDFSRLNIDLRQYFPGPQPDATVAARAMWSFSRREPGNRVPFWMQPTVGGGNDVRGYLQYRFRDENSFVANLEYRWRFFGLFQALAFADAGRVFSSPGDLGLNGIRGSVGVGGRFKLGRALVLGLDLAWSPEGVRLWYRGSQMF
jgi:outer membrane protein assembly factor BamA